MSETAFDILWKMIGLRYKSHPWHGIDIGPDAPETVTSFIEVIPSDTVKYEIDKKSGYLMIDGGEADDKIIAVLENDEIFAQWKDVADLPTNILQRLKHYFLPYKTLPGEKPRCEITHTYGREEALEVIRRSEADYQEYYGDLESALSLTLFEALDFGRRQQNMLRDL
jgi:inorganic pyrophosphatase